MEKLCSVFKPSLFMMLINIFILSSCEKKIDLGKFNSQAWINDFNGCDGSREIQMIYLDDIKSRFTGMRESQVIKILGKPNKQELGERNVKMYIYYYKPGKQCFMSRKSSQTATLNIDFDALDRIALMSRRIE